MSGRTSSAARSLPSQGGRLRERRRRARKRFFIALGVLLLLVLEGALYGLQRESLRISRVEVFGTKSPIDTIALTAMEGSYLGIIPRNSLFFYPERQIRADILEAYGDIATVSLFHNGLNGLTIRVTNRVPIARWCGAEPVAHVVATSTPAEVEQAECYLFDDSGLLFATKSEVPLVNPFVVYTPLADPTVAVRGQILPHAELLPEAFNFAREIAPLGTPVQAIAIKSPEATLMLESGTHIVYVLGREQDAYAALMSAKERLPLASGELEYIDLRFDGKVYVKRQGSSAEEQ